MGVDVASVGDALGSTPGALDYVYTDPVQGLYKKLVVSGDGKALLGAILVGDATEYGTLLQMTLNAIPLPAAAGRCSPVIRGCTHSCCIARRAGAARAAGTGWRASSRTWRAV